MVADDGEVVRWLTSGAFTAEAGGTATRGRDLAVRVTWTKNTGSASGQLRLRQQPGEDKIAYLAVISDNQMALSLQLTGETQRTLQKFPFPPGFDPTKEHTIELRAIGDEISMRLNGQLLGSARDQTLTEGTFGWGSAPGSTMRRLEYVVLDEWTPPASPAPTGTAGGK